jgi:hypothetical protein
MTYNFDPDRWYDNERRALERCLKRGEISEESFQKALEDLYRRYEQMIDRLDGTYQIL